MSPLETRLGHAFHNPALLERALTHPSRLQDEPEAEDYQRLEFLGDAVLGLTLAEALFHEFPGEREGFLARARSALAKGGFLAGLARQLSLPAHLHVSEAERAQGGHERDAALEDSLEAIIGAIYLDSDLATARACLLRWYGDIAAQTEQALRADNPKGRLQEWLQSRGEGQPDYRIADTSGPGHERMFRAVVAFCGEDRGEGEGRSKKEAEEAAAHAALDSLPTD